MVTYRPRTSGVCPKDHGHHLWHYFIKRVEPGGYVHLRWCWRCKRAQEAV